MRKFSNHIKTCQFTALFGYGWKEQLKTSVLPSAFTGAHTQDTCPHPPNSPIIPTLPWCLWALQSRYLGILCCYPEFLPLRGVGLGFNPLLPVLLAREGCTLLSFSPLTALSLDVRLFKWNLVTLLRTKFLRLWKEQSIFRRQTCNWQRGICVKILVYST